MEDIRTVWEKVAGSRPQLFTLPADHDSTIKPPNDHALARQVEACLRLTGPAEKPRLS